MEKPILDPTIPYIGPVSKGIFNAGKIIRIQGITPAIAYRFDINLQCGPATSPRDDIALQISVRILDGYVTLNSLHDGIWGEEQRGTICPIKRAEKFEVILMCDFSGYKVAINGQHYSEFCQRIHYDRITHLAIDGDVSIIQISYEQALENSLKAGLGSGLGGTSQATKLPLVSTIDNQTDDFELIDSATTTALPLGIHPPPAFGFSQPPSYDAAVCNNKRGPTTQPLSTGGSYPTGAPYPMDVSCSTTNVPYPIAGAPVPTTGVPYPTGVSASPYPLNGVGGTPNSIGFQGVAGTSPHHTSVASQIPMPPPGAPVPLNAATSNFRTAPRSNSRQKYCVTCCGILVAVVIFIVIAFIKINKRRSNSSHSSDNHYSSSYDSYGSSNSYGSDVYGGYNSNNRW